MSVDVRFIITPFLPREQPALGVSTLVSVLREAGYSADVSYLNLRFLAAIPRALYDVIANFPSTHLLGEVLFSKALWADARVDWQDYVARLTREAGATREHTVSTIKIFSSEEYHEKFRNEFLTKAEEIYQQAPAFVAEWAREIVEARPRVVGFSTTFQQNIASLALAKEIRRLAPKEELTIIFGGANCEGEMGRALARNFEFIDHVVSGEAELVIEEVVASALERKGPRRFADAPQPRFIGGKRLEDLDRLPLPNFDDYFAARAQLQMHWPAQLPVETSRGCWWGMKSHCKFCGLNGTTMQYRSKSPARARDELRALSSTYGLKRFMMADNILDTRYLKTVLPQLTGEGLTLFYEVKSNLKKEHLRVMAAAGVTWIQPGVESLSSHVLELMGKGCTALQNVQMLRWCRELGIRPSWNLLYGFPGEDASDYAEIGRFIEDLFHLHPPSAIVPVRLDRFSPYHTRAGEEGLAHVRPFWAYSYAYPALAESERHDLAYFFEFEYQDGREPHTYAREVIRAVERWGDAFSAGAKLTLLETPGGDFVYDARDPGAVRTTPLTPVERGLFELTDTARTLPQLLEEAAGRGLGSPAEVGAAVEMFRERRWLFEEKGRLVRLVTALEATERVEGL